MKWVAVLLGTLLAWSKAAETPTAPPPAAQLSDLAWMAGTWEGKGFGADLLETYSAPVGGQMPGHFRIVSGGKPTMYEFVMLAQMGATIEYRVRHFNPDMTAWEEKEKFVRFPLVALEKDAWIFDGLTIRRTGPDTVEHIVRIKRKDGSEVDEVLSYRRVKP